MCFFFKDEEEIVNYFRDLGVSLGCECLFMQKKKKVCLGSGGADLNILMVLCGLEMKRGRTVPFCSGNLFSKLFNEQKNWKLFSLSSVILLILLCSKNSFQCNSLSR